MYLSMYLSIYLSICLIYIYQYLSSLDLHRLQKLRYIYLYLSISICIYPYPPISICTYLCLSVFIYQSIYLSIYLSCYLGTTSSGKMRLVVHHQGVLATLLLCEGYQGDQLLDPHQDLPVLTLLHLQG